MNRAPSVIAVGGTGTGVGKTHVAAALVRVLGRLGVATVGFKPIETGLGDGPTDAGTLGAAAGTLHVKQVFAYAPPISPHLAARLRGERIDPAPIRARLEALRREFPAVIVELAGGLFSPLAPGLDNLGLVRLLGCPALVLVAPDRLGVLHDATATLGLARARGRAPDALVLSTPATPDDSTGTNSAELIGLGLAATVPVFPRAGMEDAVTLNVARELLDRLAER